MQRFVLTAEEKRVLIFILAVFLLGLGAKCYRAQHPSSSSPPHKSGVYPASPGSLPASARKKP